MKRISQLTLVFIASILLSSCVTQKRKGEISGIKKLYHNTTARYNGYFNADVLLNEAIVKLNEEHKDNYNKILPLYEYTDVQSAQSVASDLDEAIKKVSVVVSLHRESNWTDDSYLLFGKAQYLKKDYEGAEETLRYFSDNFNPEALKKKKSGKKKSSKKKTRKRKKKSSKKRKKVSGKKKKKASSKTTNTRLADSKSTDKPDKYFLKHRPNFQEGQLWLARVLIERELFNEANQIISKLERDPKTFKGVRAKLPEVQAYYYLKQKEYENAIAPLGLAIESAKKRNNKARFAFILAQIHQNAGRSDLALENFEKAMKYSNDYEMEFSARLSMTKNAWATHQSTSEEVIAKLNKMLKDVKNEDYKDQIYFTLAAIALKDGDKKGGIAYLQKSVFYSKGNSAQKGESYYKLASLFYQDERYVNAKFYYDTTLMNIPKTDERYDEVSRLSKNLTDIAKNIQIITLQDSLLVLSEMTDEEKRKVAFHIFKEKQKEEEMKKKAAEAKAAMNRKKSTAPAVRFGQGGKTATGISSNFFAYNDRALKKGKKDFQKRWGSRPLEDNWRRANKRGNGDFGEEDADDEGSTKEMSEEDLTNILKDVPKTELEKNAAKQKIEDASFKLGTLFRDRLENFKKSITSLDDLLKRFPKTKKELDAWYYLYLDHKDLNNNSKAKMYADKIINKYPTTTYARSLSDPDFLAKAAAKKNKLVTYYNETYSIFKQKQFKSAFDRIAKVGTIFGTTNELQAKFALLQSMCIGNLQGKKAYVNSLKDLIAKYPETPEQKRAKEILRLINGGPTNISPSKKNSKKGSKEDKEAAAKFKVEDNKVHYFIAVLAEKTKLNDAKRTVSDYNLKYHKLEKLRISNIYLGTNPGIPLLVIRRFKNKKAAMKYYNGVANKKEDYMPEGVSFKFYITTQNNYRQILKTKSLDGYDTFFEENYLK